MKTKAAGKTAPKKAGTKAGPKTRPAKKAKSAPLRSLAGKKLVDEIVSAVQEKKAEKITILDLGGASSLCDWMVICQGDNTFQCRAIARGVVDALTEKRTKPYLVEGIEEGRWVLVDFTDVVLHVFTRDLRRYYAIEEIWPAAGRSSVAEDA